MMSGTEIDDDPKSKRPKIDVSRLVKPMIVPPAKYQTMLLKHAPEALYNDMSFEFARLSTGRNLLLSSEIYYVSADGCIEGPMADIDLEFSKFVRVPGHDFLVISFYHSKNFSITVCELPAMTAISTIDACFRLDGKVQLMAADKVSENGIGRILISTKNLLYLLNINSEGFAKIISCVDMAGCAALRTLEGGEESYRGLARDLNLYHDPNGAPIAVITADGGRIVFLSMMGPQCIPPSIFGEFASSIPAKIGNAFKPFVAARRLLPSPGRVTFNKPYGVVLPMRVLHAHLECRGNAEVFAAKVWKPTAGGSTKLVTVGTDACMAISNLDDGVSFSDECLPCCSRSVTGGDSFPVHALAVYGDVAFTGSHLEKACSFWNLSTPIEPAQISIVKEIGTEMRYGKFHIQCVDFSDEGVIAFTNTNDCDDATLSFLVPAYPLTP